jgi:hypothetical protein
VDIRVKVSLSHFIPAHVLSGFYRFLCDSIDRVSNSLGQGMRHHRIRHPSEGPSFLFSTFNTLSNSAQGSKLKV